MSKRLATLVVLLCAAPVWAHDTWLLPGSFRVQPGAVLRLDLTSAMAFPMPESPVSAERLLDAQVRIGSATLPLAAQPGAEALALEVRVDQPGVAAAWVSTRERTLDLAPDEVEHYLEEVGAEAVARQWREAGRGPWRETYAKRAKTYLLVGAVADESWRKPVGLDLEIVPEADPTALSIGDFLPIRVLWQGRPLPGQAVGAVGSTPSKAVLATTDDDGRVTLTLGEAGPWLFRATRIVPSSAGPDEWHSVFTTLTLEVRAP